MQYMHVGKSARRRSPITVAHLRSLEDLNSLATRLALLARLRCDGFESSTYERHARHARKYPLLCFTCVEQPPTDLQSHACDCDALLVCRHYSHSIHAHVPAFIATALQSVKVIPSTSASLHSPQLR